MSNISMWFWSLFNFVYHLIVQRLVGIFRPRL
jgi:hypothetical protein